LADGVAQMKKFGHYVKFGHFTAKFQLESVLYETSVWNKTPNAAFLVFFYFVQNNKGCTVQVLK
jgi:hypothetical protein